MMGDALLWLALALGVAAAVAQIVALRGKALGLWPERLGWATAATTVVGFLWLLWSFIAVDLSIANVHLYTSTDLALRWRIAGTWTGREGSLLLWTAWVTIVTAAYGHRNRDDNARRLTWVLLLLFQLPMLWAVARQGTFDATPDFLRQSLPNGNGLNPTLRSSFILIHPPMMFLAYAMTTVPLAAAIGHLLTGHGQWSRASASWARLDWMLYTVAMGLGGMWAYVTLNFGGYWAWDPVEVANLLPWLALTLYLHAQVRHLRGGDYARLGPLLATLPWILTLFSTLSTRSGLWVSVHAFTDPTQTFRTDPLLRFQDILAAEPGLAPYVGLILATVAATLAIWGIRTAREEGRFQTLATGHGAVLGAFAGFGLAAPSSALGLLAEIATRITFGRPGMGLLAILFAATMLAGLPALLAPEGEKPDRKPLWRRLGYPLLSKWAVVLLGVGLLVLWLWHMAASRGWSTELYEQRAPILAVPVVLALTVMQALRAYGARPALYVTGISASFGIAGAAAWPPDRGGMLLLVTGAILVLVSVDTVRRVATNTGASKRRQLASGLLIVAALLNLVFWMDPPSTIGIAAFAFTVPWPAPLVGIALSLYGLWGTARVVADAAPQWPWHVPLIVGLLGGYWVSPLLAWIGWRLLRTRTKEGPVDLRSRRSMRRVAIYTAHLAIALALVGYAATTVLRDQQDAVLLPGQQMEVGATTLHFEDALLHGGDSLFIDRIDANFHVTRSGRDTGTVTAPLVWEQQAGAHFPLPGILRLWDRDVAVSLDRVMLSSESVCGARAVAPYEPSLRVCDGDKVAAVQVSATSLPGLDLVWASIPLMGAAMGLLLVYRKDVD